ncbi:MAG: CRTAC1 family protein [Gemmatimonadetes bacterium]|nr:CRTAC1 family protein [Gemmatimonadota bacterium]
MWFVLVAIWALAGCEGDGGGAARPSFVDVAAEAGVHLRTVSGTPQKEHIVECNTGGTALLDYDLDGDVDIFIVNGSSIAGYAPGREPRAELYRNDGAGRLTGVGREAGVAHVGWVMGATAADFNGDGWPDLYLANYGSNALYENEGDGTFVDVAAERGVDFSGWSSSAAFGDYDLDGDLDFYLANYIDFDPAFRPVDPSYCTWRGIDVFCGPRGMPGERDQFYRNDGPSAGWTFAEASGAFGIADYEYYGFAALAGDWDEDGDLDIYIANDSTPNVLYRNDRGAFADVSLLSATAYSEDGREQGGMGLAGGDYDQDGDFDLFVTNFSHDNNSLYDNNGRGFFTDASFSSALGRASISSLGWGTGFFDCDNDGDDDLFVANGHVYPAVDLRDLGTRYAQRNHLFENRDGAFVEVGAASGPGLAVEKSSRGSAFGDLDNDGDLDIVVVNIDDTPTLLRNDGGNRHNYLMVRLLGAGGNTEAIGARVSVSVDGAVQMREVRAGTSYLSQDDLRLHFGLGAAAEANHLVVRWPDGVEERIDGVAGNRLITIQRGAGLVAEGFGPVPRPGP